jgi:hypothetical protein
MDELKNVSHYGGVEIEKDGITVLWYKIKTPQDSPLFILFDKPVVDAKLVSPQGEAFSLLKIIAKTKGAPLYNFQDITNELNRLRKELGDDGMIQADGEDFSISIVDHVTGEKRMLTFGLHVKPIKEGEAKEGERPIERD